MAEKISLGDLLQKQPKQKISLGELINTSEIGSNLPIKTDVNTSIQLPKEQYDDLQKQYTSLDSTFKNLNADLKSIQNPLQNTDIKDFMPVNVFGANIIVPRIKESQPTADEPKVSENHPYKGLLRLSAKEQNIPENVYEDDSPSAIYLQNKINYKFLQDAQELESLQTPDEISAFLSNKKKNLSDLITKQKINTINTSSISDIERGNTGYAVNTKLNEDDLEEKAISDDLDAVAQSNAFKKAPVMSKDIKSWINIPNSHIISVAEQVGNDIQNISNESERALFKARGEINEGSVQYDKLHKDNLAYIGLQAEIYFTETELAKDNEIVNNKFQEIDDLTKQLQEDPTNKSLIEEIKTKSSEITPIKNSIEEKKQFIQKLYSATLELSEIGKSIARQEKADAYDDNLKDEFGASITRPISRGVQEIANAVSSTLKGSAIIGNELAFQLGTKSKEDTDIIKSNLLGDESGKFLMPSRIANKQVLEFKKDSNMPSNINWDMALQKAVSTTGEMYLMGAIGAPLAESGTILGKFGGMYLGSALVFGGDILESELSKGLSVGEASFVTGLRLGVEAGTELLNPLEFIPFNGVVPKAIGQATKGDFIRYVGNNWKTFFPKIKAAGYDIKDFLWHTGKSIGFESFEEVLSDLGNYGVDKYVINNIKPNYRQDNELTLQGEINTALTTALTMIPAGIYQGIVETKQEKTAPYLRMAAAQTPKLFLNNLEDNLKKGRITKEFYEKGVNDVKNISSLYEFNKAKIELAPEDEQSAYFNAIYNYDAISKELLSETDPEKSEKLAELLTKVSKEVEKFDKEFVPLVNNPTAQANKKEEIHIQNLKDFTSEEKLKKSSLEDLQTAKIAIQNVINNPFSQKVKQEAEKQLEKVNLEIQEKSKPVEVKEEVKEEITPIQEFENKIATASEAQLEELRNEIRLNEELSSDGRRLRNLIDTKKVELQSKQSSQETSVKKVDEEEQAFGDLIPEKRTEEEDLSKLSDLAKDSGLSVMEADINSKGKSVIPNISKATEEQKKKIDDYVTTLQQKYPEKNIKVSEQNGNLVIESSVKPVSDIKAKKADIERRRQEELDAKDKQSGKFKKDLDVYIIEKRRIIDEFIKNKGENLESIDGWNDLRGDIQELLFEGKFDEAKAKVPQTYEEKINAKYDAELADLEETSGVSGSALKDVEAKKADKERRRQELESSREILTLYDLTKPITEDSKEIISKIEEANKLRKNAQEKSEQAVKETDEEIRIALNSDADSLNEKAQILDKEVKASRDSVINNTPIKQAINSAKILGQRLLNKIKLAAKSNEWISSMPISEEEFAKFEDAIKRLSVKDMGEVTSNSEVIPDILLIEEINAKYNEKLKALEQKSTNTKSEIEAKKADIKIGKVGNTEYEVKVDGVYYQGKKLNNPENKTHKQLIEADIERRRQEELIDFTTSKISFQELKDNLNNNVNGKYPYRTIIYNDFDVYEYKDGKFFPLQVASSGNQNLESIVYQEAQGKEVNFFEGKNIRLDKTGIFHSERLTGRSPIKRLLNYKKRTGQGRIDEQFGQVIVNINAKYDAELANLNATEKANEEIVVEEPLSSAITDEKQPIVVNTIPVADSKEADKIAKKQVEKEENTNNTQFKTLYSKSSNWEKIVSKLHRLTKSEILSKYRLKVVNARDVEFSFLPEETQAYWINQAKGDEFKAVELQAQAPLNQKYLAIADENGVPLYFDENGNISTKDKGSLAISSFNTVETAEKEGVNDEVIEQIREARKNNSTLLIDSFVFAPTKSVEKTYTDTNVVLEETPLEIIQGDGNQALIKIGDKTEPIFGRKLSDNEIDSIIVISKNLGASGLAKEKQTTKAKNESERFQKAQFLTKLIFTGTGKGKINFELKYAKGENHSVVTIKQKDGTWKTPTDSELKDFLKTQRITIDYNLLDAKNNGVTFTTYKFNGKKAVVDKVYPTYQDFLKENTKVAQETISDENAKFYIVAGAIDTTAKAKVEIAENTLPKEETIKNEPVKEEESEIIAEESEEFKPIPLIDFTKKSDSSDNPFSGDLFRNKSLTNKVTEEQKKGAMEWFKNHPISQFITLNHFQHIINSDAFASWNKSAITLWEGSNFTDLYHEAWHEFSQLYLTQKQKKALYNELRNTNPEFKNLSDLEIEEVYKGGIAEDFRKYVLSVKEGKPLILGNRPKRNTFFRKIANFLREFITGNVDLQTYYERLYTGNISNYKRDVSNISFPTLNSGITLGNRTLTATETKNLYKGIDALISDFFTGINTPITVLFAKNNVLNTVYKNVYDKLSSEYKNSISKYNEQVKNVSSLTEQEKQDLKQLRQTIDNLSIVLSSWKDLVKGHSRFSPYFNATKDKIKFDEDGEIVENEISEDDITRDSSLEKDKNISSKDAASNETTYAVATLPKYDASGKKVPNPFFPFIYETVDFNATWNQLTNATNNTFTYSQLLKKIEELGNKNKSFKDLLKKLPAYKDESGNIVALTDASSRLKSAFFNDVTKPRIEEMELVIELNDKQELVSFYKSAAPTDIDKIKRAWKDNLSKITDYKKELENGEVIFDIDNIIKDYDKFILKINDNAFNKLSKEEREEVFVKRVEFLNKLGFDFNPGTLSDPEFIKLIKNNSFNNPVLGIFKTIRDNKGDTNFYKDNNNNINKLANLDLKHTETLSTQSVKNPEGNSVWLIRQWNYMSKIYNALNDRETYPTYADIIAQKWLSNLDVNVSPYAKGIFLNTLFDLETGKRRIDEKGNYATLTLESYAGVKVQGKTGVQNEGKNTTSLSDFEKLAQNVITLLTNGVQEHLRYGDKASSFGTRISHIFNPLTNKIEKREVIVPKTEFASYSYSTEEGFSLNETIPLPKIAFNYFMTALKAEIIPMMRNSKEGIGEEFQFYKDHIKKLATFEGIISPSTFEKIKKEIIENEEVNELNIDSKLKELAPLIKEDIINYIEKKAKDLQKELGITDITSLKEVTQILPKSLFSEKVDKEYKQVIPKQIMYAYVVNSFLYNVEHTKIVSSDPRFYKNPQNVIKRLSAWSATGNIFVVDQQTNEYIKSKGNAIKDAVAKKLGITITDSLEGNGVLNSVIFNDIKRETVYFKKYIDILAKSGKVSEEILKEWYKAYSKIEEADGQGYVTLDALRESKLRAGSNHWTKEHEEAYQKEAKFLAGESTEGMSQNEVATLFNPEKWQYAGNTQTETISAPVFYKFSVMPLIPSMIKNTPFEEIHNNLVKQSVGLALFSSGSKASAINNPDGKFNPFYEDYSKRTPYTGEYTINPVHFQHLKEQVNVEPEVKEKVTFSTQMRKLLFLNTFNGGVPIDLLKDMSLEEWDALPESEKLKNSNFYKLEKKFNSLISRKVDIEREKVLNQIGAVKKLTGGYKVDAQKLSDFLKAEFEKRGLPEEVINYFKVNPLTNEFAYPLDASIKRDKIEAIVYSIANRRLVQQKISGDALIQLAASGFEQMKGFENYEEDADLPFYDQEFDKDGNPLPTKAQKIKIAFSSKWKPLLNLSYNGEKIGTQERLNEAIKDDNWLKENRDKISLVAVRIPVQGLNSMESMEIFHFLPESAGNVIVVSPALVAKSGGDFDIDKLTTFFPSLSKNGELYKIPTGQEKIELGKKIKHLKNIFESITKKLDVNDVIENNLRGEIETFVFNLFDENDDIVKEAKKSLDKTLKDIEKLEKFSAKTFKEIEQLSEEISQLDEKKGVENDIISVIKEVLSHPSNFQQLTTPNGTYLLNNKEYGAEWFKENSTEDRDNTFTGLVDFSEIKRQFNSNLVGKASLGIAAVANTFFAISQRAGLHLNPHIRITGEKEGQVYDFYNFKDKWINFEHNTISKKAKDVISNSVISSIARLNKKTGKFEAIMPENRDIVEKYNNNEDINLTSLSGRFAKGKDYQISDVISQFINGFVDVANDDWVFYINAVKEYVLTMLFLTQAGVDVKTTIAFFNQPVLKEYLKELQKNKNLFTSLRDKDALTKASERAFATVLAKRQSQLSDSEVIKTIENAKKAKNIPYDLARISSKYNELFTEEKLSSSVYGSSALSADEELLVLAHFLDLKNLANNSANLQRSLNADTKKVGSRFAVTEREAIKKDVELSELFPQSIVNKMRNDSAVSAFTNEKTGIDTFVKELFEDVFPLSNNELFNNTLKKLIKNDQTLDFKYKFQESAKLATTFVNDFISYIYQKNVFYKNQPILEYVEPLFKPKTSIAKEFLQLKNKFPNLEAQFPVLSLITVDELKDKKGKILKSNLKFKYKLTDKDEIDDSVQNIRQLVNFNNPSYTKEEQLEIQEFTKKLIKFAIVQSGLNNTIFNMNDMIPNEQYTEDLLEGIKATIEAFNSPDKKQAVINRITSFYSQGFKSQNKRFFTQKSASEEESIPFNLNADRGKIFKVGAMDVSTVQTAKAKIKEDFINNLPSITSTYTGKHLDALGKNHVTVVEDNLTAKKSSVLQQQGNFVQPLITEISANKPLSDDNLTENKQLIDRLVENLINLAFEKKLKIKFPEAVAQNLITSAPETFRYISERLNSVFGYNNPNYSQEQEVTEQPIIEETKETPTQVVDKNQIYSQLGNKTVSNNVVIKSWGELKDVTKAITPQGVVSTRIKNTNEHFGNPFSHDPAGKTQGLIKTETVKEAVEKYIDWVINSQDSRAKWIREQLQSGELKSKPILYYKELGEPSHATALDYLINKYDWNNKTADKNQLQKQNITPQDFTNHSGGAEGSDIQWDKIGREFGFTNNKHYWTETKTPHGNTEISKEDFEEGRYESAKAAKRNFGYQYAAMKDSRLIRNWSQVKHSDAVFAIGKIVDTGEKIFPNQKSDTRVAQTPSVTGGTGYAVGMAINHNKPTYVFNQTKSAKYGIGWYKWEGNDFVKTETPSLTKNFAGIGTREINDLGKQAIRDVYQQTLNISQVVDSGIDTSKKIKDLKVVEDPKSIGMFKGHFNKRGVEMGLKIQDKEGKDLYVARIFMHNTENIAYFSDIKKIDRENKQISATDVTPLILKWLEDYNQKSTIKYELYSDPVVSKHGKEYLKKLENLGFVEKVPFTFDKNTESYNKEKFEYIDEYSYKFKDLQELKPKVVDKNIKGENITSKGSEFAKKLTNVGNSVGLTYKGKEYVNSEHAYQTWKSGEFNQAGYNLKGGKVRGGKIGDTFFIMTDILTEKLKQHPDLAQGINERGGLEYLQKSTHNVIGDKFWESTGQNKFIEALIQAYKNISQVVDSGIDESIQIPYFRTNRKEGEVEILPNSEGYFAESQFGKGYYISLDKPYVDHSHFEGKKQNAVLKQGILNIKTNEVIDLSGLIIPTNEKKEKDTKDIFENGDRNTPLNERFLNKGYKAVIRVVDGRALEMIIYDLNLANKLIKEQQEFKGDIEDFYKGGKYYNPNYSKNKLPEGIEKLQENFIKEYGKEAFQEFLDNYKSFDDNLTLIHKDIFGIRQELKPKVVDRNKEESKEFDNFDPLTPC